ncbi:hypothetical protein LTR91_004847 [Friedmanniomyces endolithicus]|uniref:Erythromycin esterase n=1 Tax=Friedmanniomyces endolithicus TaxID=329885 RepID=A0AAN6KTX1_9PEZI|nr:hypothetical protein LTR91_004847 [Friedmanniomyces endolithicus]
MARRSSARLRSWQSSTPKRVSLSHEITGRTPRTAPNKLESLSEHDDEMPGAFPNSPPADGTPTRAAKRINTGLEATPRERTPIKPSDSEMHPQKHHGTTVKPMQEARHLGFSNMGAFTEPPKQTSRIATLHGTPTRAPNPAHDTNDATYQFTFRREQSLELSPEAKRLMMEKREEAARIREQMIASEESKKQGDALEAAEPKEGFKKMDSIASHPSAFRSAGPGKVTTTTITTGEPLKSLKRSPSKAQLDDTHSVPQRALQRSPSKPNLAHPGSLLPRAASSHDLHSAPDDKSTSPAKRAKRTHVEDASATRPESSSSSESFRPSTPQQNKILRMHPSNPNLSHITTPTQVSMARAFSVKSIKFTAIPTPMALARSHSKPAGVQHQETCDAPMTPLLARSPSKASIFAKPAVDQAIDGGSPLLSRPPSKPSPSRNSSESDSNVVGNQSTSTQAPLLARSPLKMTFTKHQVETSASNDSDKQATVPLLARSPSKIALPTNPVTASSPGRAYGLGLMGRFNLLRASPMKSILRSPQRLYSDDPAKVAAGTHFATPPKPKRSQAAEIKDMVEGSLRKRVDFSNSTKARDESKDSRSSETPTSSALKVASQITIQSPGAGKATLMDVDYPTLPNMVSTGDDSARAPSVSPSPQKRRQTITPGDFTFRADGHGTINFGGEARSPGAGVDVMRSCGGRPSIRHVSSEPQVFTAATAVAAAPPPPMAQGSKKRKFEFENEHMSAGNMSGAEDKENDVARDSKASAEREDEDAEHRPLKRTRMSAPSLEKKPRISTYNSPTKSSAAAATNVTGTGNATTRLPTLGVKPKGTKTAVGGGKGPKKNGSGAASRQSTTTISRDRLNALAQPKKRG